MRWQLEELRSAGRRPGEDVELAAERAAERHAARLSELGQQAIDALHEDGVSRAAVSVRSASELDPRLGEQATRLELLAEESADVVLELRRYAELLDSDPGRLETIESRLAVLDGIKRKYGGTLEAPIQERPRLHPPPGPPGGLPGRV